MELGERTRCWATAHLEVDVFVDAGGEPTDQDVRDAVAMSVELDGLDGQDISWGVVEAARAARSEEGPDKPGATPPARPVSPGSPRGAEVVVGPAPRAGKTAALIDELMLGRETLRAEGEAVVAQAAERMAELQTVRHGLEKAKADLDRTHAALGAPEGWTSQEYARALRRAVERSGLEVVCTTDQEGRPAVQLAPVLRVVHAESSR